MNNLKLNNDKSEFAVIAYKSNQKEVKDFSLKIGDETIHSDETMHSGSSVRNPLGVVFDSTFEVEAHIASVCKAASFHMGNIGSIYLSEEADAQVIYAFKTSCLDYCYARLGRLSDTSLLAARLVTLTCTYDKIILVLKSLHWLSVCLHLWFKILLPT